MGIKLSVIIPAYKAEKCLPRCMDSLIPQLTDAVEVILVDDGSPDCTGEICDYYAKTHREVSAYHTENGGVSHARNHGLSAARGEYITFVDSDDYVDDDYIKTILEEIIAEPDIVWFDHRAISDIAEYHNKAVVDNINNSNIRSYIDSAILESHFNYPWDKIFRHEIIKKYKICFDETLIGGEDLLFNINVIKVSRHIKYCPKSVYNYMLNPSSATHNLKIKNIRNLLMIHDYLTDYHDNHCANLSMENMYRRELALLEKMISDVIETESAKNIRTVIKDSNLEKDISNWSFSKKKDIIRSRLVFGGAYNIVRWYTRYIFG